MSRVLRCAPPATCCGTQRRRAFFTLPKFSSTSCIDESQTQSYHERKILPYRRSELYDVIADVESYSSFLPYCTGSRILERKVMADGVGVMEAELAVGFLAFRESYLSTVTCKPHERVEAAVSSSTSLFTTLTTVWCLQSVSGSSALTSGPYSQDTSFLRGTLLEQESTLVTLDLAFAFANPVHAIASATFFGRVSKLMVKAFEQRCATLYGPSTS